jgi:hypothetical protein
MDITVKPQIAYALKLQEFEKNIAEKEAEVAILKKDRSNYIYQTLLEQIVANKEQQ